MVLCTASRFRRFLAGRVSFKTLPDDVSLVRIYFCTYCKGYGRKNEASGTCVSARFDVSCEATNLLPYSRVISAKRWRSTFFSPFYKRKRPYFHAIGRKSRLRCYRQPRFVLDSIAMYRNRIVVYILAY